MYNFGDSFVLNGIIAFVIGAKNVNHIVDLMCSVHSQIKDVRREII